RMLHERREHVVLEARRGRLYPAESTRGREEVRRELAEEGVGVGDGRARLALVLGVDDGHGAGRFRYPREALRLDGGMDDELHAQGSSVGSAGGPAPAGPMSMSSRS